MHKLLACTVALLSLAGCQRETASSADCIDPSKIKADAMCTMEYAPVCGCNNQTYGNACQATNAGVKTYTKGPCPDAAQPKG
ncbi:Kazal-type serine protease inhibitor [Hymenobacter sp. UYP22]|uniref:Kazal-type serine protease inhibitor family protein n=1 Tax=Hymenobacter sp. UYP22 TaxID=3156348 RepID=UPI0033930CAA